MAIDASASVPGDQIRQLDAQRLGFVIDLDDAVSTAVVELAVLDSGVPAEQFVVSGRGGWTAVPQLHPRRANVRGAKRS